MTYEDVQQQLSGVTYQEAINYYTLLRLSFKSQYQDALQDSQKHLSNMYIDDFINEINSNNLRGEAFRKSTELMETLESALTHAMEGQQDSLKTLEQNLQGSYSELTKKGKEELAKELDRILSINAIDSIVRNYLMSQNLGSDSGVNPQDILNWTKSFLLSGFFTKLKGNDVKGRKDILAGYFEEALVHKATHRLTSHLTNKTSSFHTGSQKVHLNNYTIDSVFDEYFNFFNNDLSATFHESIFIDDEGYQSLSSGFGAQVKLWSAPGDAKNLRNVYKIANNATLFNQWKDKQSWIKGVKFLEDKVKNVHGDNVMYILGNKFYWTSDLITRFREQQYYLAFHHNGNEFTKSAGWEPIDMSKPYN